MFFNNSGELSIRDMLSEIFNNFNINKISMLILHERTGLVKELIACGGQAEVRHRSHHFSAGKYHNVIEVAVFRRDLRA